MAVQEDTGQLVRCGGGGRRWDSCWQGEAAGGTSESPNDFTLNHGFKCRLAHNLFQPPTPVYFFVVVVPVMPSSQPTVPNSHPRLPLVGLICIISPVDSSRAEIMFYSFLKPQHSGQEPACSRCSVSICWANEQTRVSTRRGDSWADPHKPCGGCKPFSGICLEVPHVVFANEYPHRAPAVSSRLDDCKSFLSNFPSIPATFPSYLEVSRCLQLSFKDSPTFLPWPLGPCEISPNLGDFSHKVTPWFAKTQSGVNNGSVLPQSPRDQKS